MRRGPLKARLPSSRSRQDICSNTFIPPQIHNSRFFLSLFLLSVRTRSFFPYISMPPHLLSFTSPAFLVQRVTTINSGKATQWALPPSKHMRELRIRASLYGKKKNENADRSKDKNKNCLQPSLFFLYMHFLCINLIKSWIFARNTNI